MKLTLLVLLMVSLFIPGCFVGCNKKESKDLKPYKEFSVYVQESTKNWLDLQMEEKDWEEYKKIDWAGINTLDEVVTTLRDRFPAFWSFSRHIRDLKMSDLYDEKITDAELLEFIKKALGSYEYKEE